MYGRTCVSGGGACLSLWPIEMNAMIYATNVRHSERRGSRQCDAQMQDCIRTMRWLKNCTKTKQLKNNTRGRLNVTVTKSHEG